jgi:phage terminase large subunit
MQVLILLLTFCFAGEFPCGETDAVISLEAAEFAKDEVVIIPKGDTSYIGSDIARFGDDETEMYARLNAVPIDSHFQHNETRWLQPAGF